MTILQGDAYQKLQILADETYQTCITSPPYWNLRSYCEGELGNEPTPEEFAANLVCVFRGVRRILKPTGTLWLNLGDSYCGGGGYAPNAPSNQAGSKQSSNRGSLAKRRPVPPGYKTKDLAGIPWLVAHELRKDGWYLRADIIWDRPDAFPEKVYDRPTRTHEYVFLLSKSPKYYYNAAAIKEPAAGGKTRNKRCVWRINKSSQKGVHTAVFPEELVETCLLAGSAPGDMVLDPFSGSGTTGVVCKRLGRDFTGIELNPEYVKVSQERIMGV